MKEHLDEKTGTLLFEEDEDTREIRQLKRMIKKLEERISKVEDAIKKDS